MHLDPEQGPVPDHGIEEPAQSLGPRGDHRIVLNAVRTQELLGGFKGLLLVDQQPTTRKNWLLFEYRNQKIGPKSRSFWPIFHRPGQIDSI